MIVASLPLGALGSETFRSFFGVHKVVTSSDGRFRKLEHGTTLHGAMRILNDDGTPALGRPEPTTYYTMEGTIGSSIASIRNARGGQLWIVAVVGLGTGSLACHAAPGETWAFFELDAAVRRIASDSRYFRFLAECAPDARVTLGDARLTFAAEHDRKGLIAIDAFSSDAIPAHLITKEAIGMYLTKLDPTGVLLVHFSNRHLDLRNILARVGAEHGLTTYVISETHDEPLEKRLRAPSQTAVLARDPAHLGRIISEPSAQHIPPDMGRRPWADDFSNILEAILDKRWPASAM
jgi:hypothetical protein